MALDCQGICRIYECIHNITQCKWLCISVYSILYSIYSLSNSLPKHTHTHAHTHLWRWTTAPYNIINIIIVIYFIILFVFAVPVLGRWLLISFDEVMRPRLPLWLSLQLPDLPLDPPALPSLLPLPTEAYNYNCLQLQLERMKSPLEQTLNQVQN